MFLLLALAIRQKSLNYSHFSMKGIRQLLFPDPRVVDLSLLADIFKKGTANKPLERLANIDNDAVRAGIDAAVAKTLGFDSAKIERMRTLIAEEPLLTKVDN